MDFPFGQTVYRLRGAPIIDPYSGEQIDADWDNPGVLPIPGAFVAQTSTSMLATATREQALESKSLFCEGAFDVKKGDRVFTGTFTPPLPDGAISVPDGTVMAGETYSIDGIPPAADTNPFTGWTPPREIPLRRGVG
ncbi:hypothetical protein [Microbacterium sp. AR7-10]|uniref:hypothetical protein n=1 Tax=Microbacterium sp. AR7-10 TaxID=1891970 RepID=UPI0008FC8B8A|nr:hypothetical protein [Microbacterium sp. AR7-10]OIU88657.1 hypothetical protein BFN01_04230 [Microbacterium sp. AR7-10]